MQASLDGHFGDRLAMVSYLLRRAQPQKALQVVRQQGHTLQTDDKERLLRTVPQILLQFVTHTCVRPNEELKRKLQASAQAFAGLVKACEDVASRLPPQESLMVSIALAKASRRSVDLEQVDFALRVMDPTSQIFVATLPDRDSVLPALMVIGLERALRISKVSLAKKKADHIVTWLQRFCRYAKLLRVILDNANVHTNAAAQQLLGLVLENHDTWLVSVLGPLYQLAIAQKIPSTRSSASSIFAIFAAPARSCMTKLPRTYLSQLLERHVQAVNHAIVSHASYKAKRGVQSLQSRLTLIFDLTVLNDAAQVCGSEFKEYEILLV